LRSDCRTPAAKNIDRKWEEIETDAGEIGKNSQENWAPPLLKFWWKTERAFPPKPLVKAHSPPKNGLTKIESASLPHDFFNSD
jgi:hypothetical protein